MRTLLGGASAPPLLHFCRGSRKAVTFLNCYRPPPPPILQDQLFNRRPWPLINSPPPWKALRAGVKQGGATKLLLNGPKSAYFGTNFINWGWIGFTTAPATATATATATTTTAAAQRQLGGFDHDCCGSTAAWWLRPRQRLRPRLLRLNDDGDYDVGDGDDCGGHGHDC